MNQAIKTISMNEMSSKPMYVRMEPADNGVVITYDIKKPNGNYDYTTQSKREVFAFKANDKAGMTKAMQRFCELACMGEEDDDEGDDD